VEPFVWVRTFHTSSRAASGRRASHFAGRPRLAASLPARPGSGHRETGGHAEAPASSPSGSRGSRSNRAQTTTGRRRAGRSAAARRAARTSLRRAGPPALRPGTGLRRPGLLAPNPRRLRDAPTRSRDPSRTEGDQTAPAWSRSYVRWGAPPGPGGRGPDGWNLRDGMPGTADRWSCFVWGPGGDHTL
jgi:hypothetical protein